MSSNQEETIDRQDTEPTVSQKPDKIIVAIHGIGDQYHNATIQSVLNRLGYYFSYSGAAPLGAFYRDPAMVEAFLLQDPVPSDPLRTLGFAEVYWADIPRGVQQEGYILEESKAWARTVVRRVRARFGKMTGGFQESDYESAATVIEEMIETIGVLQNLLFLAEKMFKFKFDLNNLLTAYLGDIQIVTEFESYRRQILDTFNRVISKVCKGNENAKLYIIAHSEGTVVAFMGLLEAMCGYPDPVTSAKKVPSWVDQLSGFMTFGSPIDKHLILWPKLWDRLQTKLWQPNRKIPWYNYYDLGDPVGFNLETARDWIKTHGWCDAFDFPAANDFGFSRYPLPGKAHNDYWEDPYVFGHFLQNVVRLDPPPAQPGARRPNFKAKPPSRSWVRVVSFTIPYFISFILLGAGVFLLHKAVTAWTKDTEDTYSFCRNVVGITSLLFGMTIFARIIRLVRKGTWWCWATLISIIGAGGYVLLVSNKLRDAFGFHFFANIPHWRTPIPTLWFPKHSPQDEIYPLIDGPTIFTIALAFGACILSARLGRKWPRLGMLPLLVPGGFIVAAVVLRRLFLPQ
ncbi:MAG TPA: hypothetical protein VGQ95_02905 [Chthoniobacterales bacterium]|nr:hypothetical protein [Chthoniobacterales bacterium]